MIRRTIGRDGRPVNAIGLGCMGMAAFYGKPLEESEAVALLHSALDLGVDHFDTAELYGNGLNERQLGAAFHDRRDKVFIATKFGPLYDWETFRPLGVDASMANATRALDNSLRYLRTDHVDLWYLHRRDRSRPIEEIVETMASFVKAGKVRAIGLSEVNADTIRAAAKVHPIAAIQSEYSIFTRFVEDGVLQACKDVGATLVAYSPLGRGMLTGAFKSDYKGAEGDFRSMGQPRFQGEALANNVALVDEIERIAKVHNAKSAQVALAWLLARADHVVAIPGTTKLENLRTNLGGGELALSASETEQLNALAERVVGERYNPDGMTSLNG